MTPLVLRDIEVRGVRNLKAATLRFSDTVNLFVGSNGQGKTSLLEACYLGATSKSFRSSKLAEVVQHNAADLFVKCTYLDQGLERVQSIGIAGNTRTVRVEGKRPSSLVAYASRSPVVLFHPGEMTLSMGSSGERRRLLDRALLYTDPNAMESGERYREALRARQKLLEQEGVRAASLEAYEMLLVRHGLEIVAARRAIAATLLESTTFAFKAFGTPDKALLGRYETNTPDSAGEYLRALLEARGPDLRRKAATVGPHRDDLLLFLGDHAARVEASQGQHRAIVMSLKYAEAQVIAARRGVLPLLFLDDVSSELDRERLDALLQFFVERRGQIFVTSTRREWLPEGLRRAKTFTVSAGTIIETASSNLP